MNSLNPGSTVAPCFGRKVEPVSENDERILAFCCTGTTIADRRWESVNLIQGDNIRVEEMFVKVLSLQVRE